MKPRSLAGIVLGVVAPRVSGVHLHEGSWIRDRPHLPSALDLVGRLALPTGGHTCPDRRLPDSGRSVVLFHTSTQ